MSLPAYQIYQRSPVQSFSGELSGMADWLNLEFGNIQPAIPVRATKTVTTAYTLTPLDDVVLVDCTAGAIIITWPDPTRSQHFTATVKKIDATANVVTFASVIASTGAAATFDGVASPTLVSRWDSRTMRSDGVQYYQKNSGIAVIAGTTPASSVTAGTFAAGNFVFPALLTVTGALTASGGVAGNVTGNLTGNVTGNLTGAVTGNASTATTLQTPRAINGVNFDGSAAITVTAAAGTLTGATLNGAVLASSLTSVGTLTGLTVGGNLLINAGGTLTLGGDELPATDNAYNIGSGAKRIKDIQAMTGTFTTSLTITGTSSLATATAGSLTITGGTGAAGRRYMDTNFGLVDWGITGAVYDYALMIPSGAGTVFAVLTGTNTLYLIGDTRANGQCNPNVDNSASNRLGNALLRWYDIRVMTGTFSGLLTAASLAVTGATTFSKEARLWNTTVAGLTAAGTAGAGATAFVTDSTLGIAAGLGVAVIGGGANKVPVYSDGVNWIIG